MGKKWEKFINNINEIKNDTSMFLQFNAEENGNFSQNKKSFFIKNHFIQVGKITDKKISKLMINKLL